MTVSLRTLLLGVTLGVAIAGCNPETPSESTATPPADSGNGIEGGEHGSGSTTDASGSGTSN